jgi:hypothetical protein
MLALVSSTTPEGSPFSKFKVHVLQLRCNFPSPGGAGDLDRHLMGRGRLPARAQAESTPLVLHLSPPRLSQTALTPWAFTEEVE